MLSGPRRSEGNGRGWVAPEVMDECEGRVQSWEEAFTSYMAINSLGDPL